MRPEETACLDVTMAHRYLRPVPYALMLMAGEIHPHNQVVWKKIVEEAIGLSDQALITLGTEREGKLIRQWAEAMGKKAELRDNDADPFYDAWVCSVKRR